MGLATTRIADAKEGYIAIASLPTTTVVFEARCETDFVGRNDVFRQLAQIAADQILNEGKDQPALDNFLGQARSKFKENVQATAAVILGQSASYVYQDGKKAAIVIYSGENTAAARTVAIQIVATRPKFASREDVDPEYLAKETQIAVDEAVASGKPEQIAKRIAEGKVSSKLKDFVLLEQPMYSDPKVMVKDFVKENGITIEKFSLILVGAE